MALQGTRLAQAPGELMRFFALMLHAKLSQSIVELSPKGIRPAVPRQDDFYLPGNHFDETFHNGEIAVVIEQHKSATIIDPGSGDGEWMAHEVMIPIKIRALWASDAWDKVDHELFGRPKVKAEVYQEVAQAYQGAVIECVKRWGTHLEMVSRTDLTNFMAGVTSRNRMRAIAMTEWNVRCETLVPMDRRALHPDSQLTF